MSSSFQLDGQGPAAYERYLVPRLFATCADQLLDLVAVTAGDRVVDLACGTGIVARRAAAAVGAGGAVVGVDVNDGMLAVASALTDGTPVLRWCKADATAVPLSDGDFDKVCCQQGLQFFPDRPLAVREAHRLLAPGGRIGLAVWRSLEHHPVYALLVDALERHVGAEAADMMRAPFEGPDGAALRDLLTDAGFGRPVVRIGAITARFPSPREFLRQEVVSTPLAEPVGALGTARLDALVTDLDRALTPYTDDEGMIVPMQTWLATAVR